MSGLTTDDDRAAQFIHDAMLRALRVAKRDAWEEAVILYAVWKDGEQIVGVQQRPLTIALNDNPYMGKGDSYVVCAFSGCDRKSGRRRRQTGCDYCSQHRED